jgi:hydrogenase maturation factor
VTCHGDHCVTCSDEGLLVRVVEVQGDGIAVCEDGAEVMTDLVGAVVRGEMLLVHAGVALARVAA